jgi:hypothetical protein
MERYINLSDARNYSNLQTYKSHGPPNYGKGINAPYFASSPMRSPFARGNIPIPTNIVHHTECCDTYNDLGNMDISGYINPKMLRQKK